MDHKYDHCIDQWNDIFSEDAPAAALPPKSSTGNTNFDNGLKWLCKDSKSLLDFGCGSGGLLFICSNFGTQHHVGVDLSENAIRLAKKRSEALTQGHYTFIHGSIEALKAMEKSTFDAIILSNIIDNLYPEDAQMLLCETERLLKDTGKVFVKLNPHLTDEQISAWEIKVIQDNLLDDGLILWNNSSAQWAEFFQKKFEISHQEDLYFPEHDQINRVFCLEKRNIS